MGHTLLKRANLDDFLPQKSANFDTFPLLKGKNRGTFSQFFCLPGKK